MAKHFSKNYRNKGRAINYPVPANRNKFLLNKSYVKMPVSACCYIPTSVPQEQAAKTNMPSVVRILQKQANLFCQCNEVIPMQLSINGVWLV